MKMVYALGMAALLIGCGSRAATTADADTDPTPDVRPNVARDAGIPTVTDAGTPTVTDAGTPVATDTGTITGPAGTRSVQIGPLSARPGEEHTVCVRLDVGNAAPVMVRSIRTHLTNGSHHMIVTRVATAGAAPEPTPCGPFAHGGDRIFIAQQREAGLTYPAGAGLRFEAHQIVGLEMHYINYFSDAPADISGAVEFDTVPIEPGAPLREVQMLFTGTLSLSLPAHQRTTVESHVNVPAGGQIFALTSHTHQLGVHSTIHRVRAPDTAGTLLHEATSWSEPPLNTYDPAFALAPGEQLKLTCEYNNTTDRNVGFGFGFEDEMCFLWAHYLAP